MASDYHRPACLHLVSPRLVSSLGRGVCESRPALPRSRLNSHSHLISHPRRTSLHVIASTSYHNRTIRFWILCHSTRPWAAKPNQRTMCWRMAHFWGHSGNSKRPLTSAAGRAVFCSCTRLERQNVTILRCSNYEISTCTKYFSFHKTQIGDLKFGELKGTDKFGNKYYEV